MRISLERVCVNNSQVTIKSSQVVYRNCGDSAEFGKNATQIMSFLPQFMWAENNNTDYDSPPPLYVSGK